MNPSKYQMPSNDMRGLHVVNTLPKLFGNIMYVMDYNIFDFAYNLIVASRYIDDPNKKHWEAMK